MNPNNRPTHESLEEVIEAFQRMSVPDRPGDAEVLGRLSEKGSDPLNSRREIATCDTDRRGQTPFRTATCRDDSPRPVSKGSPSKRPYLVRFLVSSAAAALLLAGGLGLLLLNSTVPLAVADVVKSAQKHKLVRYHQQQTVFKEEKVNERIDSTVYADLTGARLRSESHAKRPDGEPVLVSVEDNVRRLAINSRERTAWLGLTPKDFKSFCCSLEEFEQKKGVNQIKDMLGDLATVKYSFEDGNQKSSLWVDTKTKLPVRMEEEVTDATSDITRTKSVWTDFEWGPELPKGFKNLDELFSTRPPEGYALDDQTKEKKQK